MAMMTEHGVGKICPEDEHAMFPGFRAPMQLELPLKEYDLGINPHHKTNAT